MSFLHNMKTNQLGLKRGSVARGCSFSEGRHDLVSLQLEVALYSEYRPTYAKKLIPILKTEHSIHVDCHQFKNGRIERSRRWLNFRVIRQEIFRVVWLSDITIRFWMLSETFHSKINWVNIIILLLKNTHTTYKNRLVKSDETGWGSALYQVQTKFLIMAASFQEKTGVDNVTQYRLLKPPDLIRCASDNYLIGYVSIDLCKLHNRRLDFKRQLLLYIANYIHGPLPLFYSVPYGLSPTNVRTFLQSSECFSFYRKALI